MCHGICSQPIGGIYWVVAIVAALGCPAKLFAESPEYNRDIRPILSSHCFQCHGFDAKQRQAGLRLDVREQATTAADSGLIAIVPGMPEQSELLRRIDSHDADERMPPATTKKELTDRQRRLLRQWIQDGAAYETHWSFTPPKRPRPPEVGATAWPRGDIDRFVLAALEERGLAPSPEADRVTLVRRLSLDLTGLPPTPAIVDAFVADQRPDAYERLVEQFFQSPHHGERMAMDWLDAARYADTHGFHIDSGRDMSRWRRWVIDAFNQNLPFDRFTVEQLAGDLLPGATDEQKIASGFNRNHMINFEGGAIPEEYHNAYIVDRVNTTGAVWLGLTIGCAQCHDHKYDPITQREYYQFYAFFYNVPERGLDGAKGNASPVLRLPTPEQRAELNQLSEMIARLDKELAAPLPQVDAEQATWEQAIFDRIRSGGDAPKPNEGAGAATPPDPPKTILDLVAKTATERDSQDQSALRKYFRSEVSPVTKPQYLELSQLQQRRAAVEEQVGTTMIMEEMPQPRETFVLMRGQYDRPGERVTAATPSMLPPLPSGAPPSRLGLAQWLVDPRHPLVARVIVNRYWQMFFGVGLVKTSEDLGSQGEWPSHPELLDYLATDFSNNGWDVRSILRKIVLSATYRQSSSCDVGLRNADPENRWLARGPRFRLQAELIRDQALAASGLLDRRIGGPSVNPYQPPGLWEELMSRADGDNWTAQKYTQSHGADLYRRSMYTFWKRTSPPAQLATFDAPDRETCVLRRARTNTPLQALVLMNDPTYVEAARKLAESVLQEPGLTDVDRLTRMTRLVLVREPTEMERHLLSRLIEEQQTIFSADREAAEKLLAVGESPRDSMLDTPRHAAWTVAASALLNLDEAVTKE